MHQKLKTPPSGDEGFVRGIEQKGQAIKMLNMTGKASKIAGASIVGLAAVAFMFPSAANAAVPTTLLNDTFAPTASAPLNKVFTDTNTFTTGDKWYVNFAGYGSVKIGQDAKTTTAPLTQYVRLTPSVASADWDTHSALVTSNKTFTQTCNVITARQRTVKQLRTTTPANPWEVSWLVWDYKDNDHFTYLAVKPNGWELGKRDPAYLYGQRFLATGELTTPIGQWRSLNVKRSSTATNSTTTVTMDGVKLTSFVDTQNVYKSGKVGMYTEDAVADWDSFKVTTC